MTGWILHETQSQEAVEAQRFDICRACMSRVGLCATSVLILCILSSSIFVFLMLEL